MKNTRTDQVSIEAAAAVLHLRARAGYLDAAAGRPYRPNFDRWSADEQLAYETTRLWVAAIRSKGRTPPAWPNEGPPPLVVRQEAGRACGAGVLPVGKWKRRSKRALRLEAGSLALPRRRR